MTFVIAIIKSMSSSKMSSSASIITNSAKCAVLENRHKMYILYIFTQTLSFIFLCVLLGAISRNSIEIMWKWLFIA